MQLSLFLLGVVGTLADVGSGEIDLLPSPSPSPDPDYRVVDAKQANYFETMLDDLWAQTDADGSGDLDEEEFVSALAKLGISETLFTKHSQSATVLFADLDENSNGAITKEELVNVAIKYPEYQEPFISAFTNGVMDIPSITDVIPSDELIASGATVTVTLVVAGSPESIYKGQREMIQQYFADLAGVETEMVIITFLSGDRRRLTDTWEQKRAAIAPGRRKLSETTVIEATIFVEDESAADQLLYAAMPENAEALSSVPAFAGLEVTEFEATSALQFPDLPYATIGIVAAILFFVGNLLCKNAGFWAKKNYRKKKAAGDTTKPSCCGTGCCSFNAVRAWAFGELVAAGCIIGTVFYLYQNVSGVTNAIIGMIETLVAIILFVTGISADSPFATLASFSNQIPRSIIDIIEQNLDQLRLLPIATMVPGLLAAFFLLLAGLCPMSKANKGSYCGTKCMILFADLLLVVCIGFYITFAAFAVVITYAPPIVKDQISFIRNICVTVPALFEQRISDGQQTLAMLETAGQADMLGEITETIGDVSTIAQFAVDACGYLTDFFEEMMAIFLPGLMCVVAIFFALFVNQTLCCAAGCCVGPPKVKPVAAGKDGADNSLQAI